MNILLKDLEMACRNAKKRLRKRYPLVSLYVYFGEEVK